MIAMPNVYGFISQQCEIIRTAGVEVILSETSTVQFGNTTCNGFFSDETPKQLVVATGKPFLDWLPVFVHETCHFDQWIEQDPVWTNKIGGAEPMFILDLWLNNEIELNNKQRSKIVQAALQIELDCEKRAVQKYINYQLHPYFNEVEYTKKANAYVYFYLYLEQTRKWYIRAPYAIESVWTHMPDTFDNSYAMLPHEYAELFDQCYKEQP